MDLYESFHNFSGPICIEIFNTYLITSNICTSLNETRRPKISFSCLEECGNQLTIFQFGEDSLLYERWKVCLQDLGVSTMWMPHPCKTQTEIIAAAGSNLELFHLDERGLTHLTELMENNVYNKIISFDWNRCQPEQIAALRNNGECQILNYNIETPRRQIINSFSFTHGSVLRYGGGFMRNSFLCLEKDGNLSLVDLRNSCKQRLHHFGYERMINMEYCMNDDYAIAFSNRRRMKLFDVRFMKRNYFQYENEIDDISCFCWSPNSHGLFIGTSTGRIIQRPFSRFPETCASFGFYTRNIHCPPLLSHVLLFTNDAISGNSVFLLK